MAETIDGIVINYIRNLRWGGEEKNKQLLSIRKLMAERSFR
jgi:hypothetical protein